MNEIAAWGELSAALIVFFLSHMIPARPQIRRYLIGRLGRGSYILLYALISVGLLAWVIAAAGRAPFVPVWDFEPWQIWVPNIAMPFACVLIALGIGAPNPFSIAGRPSGFDPRHPGVAGLTRHPLLWALTLWAGAHMVPNGDLAHVILFGLFAGFGLAGMIALDRRKKREWGEELWAAKTARTSFFPLGAVLAGRLPLPELALGPVRLLAGAALYVSLLLLHQTVIGVSPLPSF